jgi:uncharacterized protein (TIGR02117 family)
MSGDVEAMAAWSCESRQRDCHNIYIVSNQWHAGIVVRRSEIAAKTLPEIGDFPNVQWIEVSWGDQDYFPDPDAGVYAALRAAFWSNGSVLHLVGFNDAVENFYRGAAVYELRLSKDAFARLLFFIAGTFVRPDPALPAKPRLGLFTYSRFYSATGKFSIARTCNTWVAEALAHAGLPLDAASVITAGQLNGRIDELLTRK